MSLLTCAPGCEIYELEGHTGLRLRTDSIDIVANWGLFDFASPNFVYRFVKGETDYMAGICPTELFLAQYIYEKRRVTEQVLNLTPTQANRVMELVMENCAPQNRVYRYNYVRNNCATKPVAVIEAVVGEPIEFGVPAQACENDTWRTVMRRYHKNYPWYQFGIDLALGGGLDYPLAKDEDTFAPPVLEWKLARAKIGGAPLVKETNVIFPGYHDATLPPTPWILTPMAAGLAMLLVSLGTLFAIVRYRRYWRVWISAYFLLAGVAGCVITFLVFFSSHEATSPNWLLVWLNPLQLILGAGVWVRSWRKILVAAAWYDTLMPPLLALLWIFIPQVANPAVWPMLFSAMPLAMSVIYYYKRIYK